MHLLKLSYCYGPLAIPPLSLLCVNPKRPTES